MRVNTSEVTDEDCSGCEEVDEDVDAAVHRRVVTQVRSFVFTPETMYMLS